MREKQRAKDEVNRLNGVVSGSSSGAASQEPQSSNAAGAPWRRRPIFHPPSSLNDARQQATPAERRRQLAQLAEMGIAVPEEFRGDLAMAGDWQVVSERVIHDDLTVKKEEDEQEEGSNGERKYTVAEGLNIGVRKRRYEGHEEEEENEAGEMNERKGWGSGSRLHTYPADSRGEEEDLDSLLGKTKVRIEDQRNGAASGSLSSPPPHSPPPVDQAQRETDTVPTNPNPLRNPPIKQEDANETKPLLPPASGRSNLSNNNLDIKSDPDGLASPEQPEIVFKKRKAKPIRNR